MGGRNPNPRATQEVRERCVRVGIENTSARETFVSKVSNTLHKMFARLDSTRTQQCSSSRAVHILLNIQHRMGNINIVKS